MERASGPRPSTFRRRYGAGPLHLLAAISSLAVVAYALLEVADRPAPLSFAAWFAGAIIAHDLIAFPLYSLLARVAGEATRAAGERASQGLNYVRVPAVLSGLAFVVWFPLILGLSSETYEKASGMSTDPYLGRWLALTAALFAISGLVYAISLRRGHG